MNNVPPFFQGFMNNNFNSIEMIVQEIKRLERRITNIEKSLIPVPYNKIKPTPLEATAENYMNNNYTKDNYII